MKRTKPRLRTSHIQVRTAVPSDAQSIACVLYASFVEHRPDYTDEAFAATTPTSEQIERRMSEGQVWLALLDSAVVGTVFAVPSGEALYVRSMAVLPTVRGLGVGKLLLEHVESFACAHGYGRLFLSTTPFLTRAIQLYEHRGFLRSSEGPHDLFGTPLFTMVKNIAPQD